MSTCTATPRTRSDESGGLPHSNWDGGGGDSDNAAAAAPQTTHHRNNAVTVVEHRKPPGRAKAKRAALLSRLVALAVAVEAETGAPQDIEGCVVGNDIYVLQSRNQVL